MTCNDTLEAVDIEATFVGASLDIDTFKPPVHIESTARSVSPSQTDLNITGDEFGGGDLYSWLPSIAGPPNNLDAFFSILTTSRYAQPLSALGDPARREDVANAIKLQHGIITVAMLSTRTGSARD
ncbi:hypothetical protein F4823DRAFT_591726 [Ustulina deusta]|nr:hypothetical protein F4823DRAFT_591726 [Ustulina deusta]